MKKRYSQREKEWQQKVQQMENEIEQTRKETNTIRSESAMLKDKMKEQNSSEQLLFRLKTDLSRERRLRQWLAAMSQGTIMAKYDYGRRRRQRRWVSLGTTGTDGDLSWELRWGSVQKRKKRSNQK